MTSGIGLELGLELLLRVVRAPLDDDLLVGDAVGLADVAPALAELSGVDGDGLVAGGQGVDDGRLHRPRARGGQDVDVLLRAEDVLQALGHLHEDLGEFGRPVVDDGLGRGGQDGLRNRRRAGGEKVILFNHESSF